MKLAEKSFYQFPDKRLHCCNGIIPRLDNHGWRFAPPQGCPIDPMETTTLPSLQEYILEEALKHQVTLPSKFGLITRSRHERLQIKKDHLTFQFTYPLNSDLKRLKNEKIHFQFAEHNIYSFTQAITAASKTRDAIILLQGGQNIASLKQVQQ